MTSSDVWNPYSEDFSAQETQLTSSITCPNYDAGKYELSGLTQVSLQDALAASKLQQPLRLNAVSTVKILVKPDYELTNSYPSIYIKCLLSVYLLYLLY